MIFQITDKYFLNICNKELEKRKKLYVRRHVWFQICYGTCGPPNKQHVRLKAFRSTNEPLNNTYGPKLFTV